MIRSVWTAGGFLFLALLAAGCGGSINKPIVTYERDSATVPPSTVADRQGLYALFPGNGVTPLAAVYLHVGDKFGFENQDGKIVGVYIQAGQSKSVPLDGVLTTDYVWKYQGDKQP